MTRRRSALDTDLSRRALLTGLSAAALSACAATAAGLRSDSSAPRARAVASRNASAATTMTTTTASVPPAPEVETGIAAGTSGRVVYTPASSSSPQSGTLMRPAGTSRTTAIVLVHGGGGTIGDSSNLWAWQELYRTLGYPSLSIDYRLLDPEVDRGIWPLPEQHVKAAVQYLRLTSSELGVTAVVVQGHSAGARLGGIISTTPDLTEFQGQELWGGVSDAPDGFVGFYGYYDGYQFEPAAYFGEDGVWPTAADAIAGAHRSAGWTMLVHGTGDELIDIDESRRFADALTDAGQPVAILELPDAAHGFDMTSDGVLTTTGQQAARSIVAEIERRS